MIGVRVECDVTGCGRHFDADGEIEFMPRAHHGTGTGQFYAVFSVPFIALPIGWTATSPPEGRGIRLLCADHADDEAAPAGEGFAHG